MPQRTMFGGSIEIRLDGVNGQCIGKVDIKNTKDEYKTLSLIHI